ncbi:hypothetical protein LJC14_01470 [Treponema sp. OttesenSCG-928-L16]|nr:hypothetical protein [Treponema sp. OttesenSCG-928-L16]
MNKDLANLEVLSTRAGFNSAVRHIKKTIEIIDSVGVNKNLADLLFEMGDEELSGEKTALVLRILLIDKLGYKAVSTNLSSVAGDPASLAEEFAKWKAVDMVAAYHHPDMGLLVANPKMPEELASFGMLRKRELLVIYAGKAGNPADGTCTKAADIAAMLFEGAEPKIPADLYKGNFTVKKLPKPAAPKAAAPAKKKKTLKAAPKAAAKSRNAARTRAAAPVQEAPVRVAAPAVTSAAPPPVAKGPVRMTPMYSVVVQNELFHNGNVEAWKKIVASYKAKYPDLQVYIYYDGERILDINSLFKWGKVKHGSAIQFAIAGSDIKDVAKLQRYLIQGASHQFEAFLHGPVNNVLKLF